MRRSGGGGKKGDAALGSFVVGILLVGFAMPMIWFNEYYQVKLLKLYKFAETQCVPNVDAEKVDP